MRNNTHPIDRFQVITAFVRVVETGSFVRAADRLDVSVSAISRQVAELEAHLDARLLHRTTRRLSLTESGRAFHERCLQLLADLDEAEQSANAGTVKPRGTLRLTCSVTFGARHLAAAIADYFARYPQLRFDIELSDRATDLIDEGFDVAVRIGAIGSTNLVGRKVGETRLLCVAAPSYLARHGEPRRPEDLAKHLCLTYEYSANRYVWPFRDAQGRERNVRIAGPIHANHGRFLEALAVAGVGVAYEPDFIVGPDVRTGRVVPLLRKFQAPPSSIYVVYPSRRHLSAKVRTFADFLSERFAQPEWTLAG
ncbi:MAG: LysR substrate-binding domain-containing protein [Casimicrobiaceae bacterium]